MYGNERLPGIAKSETYSFEGSLWRGYTEATWLKHVKVTGTTGDKLPKTDAKPLALAMGM